MIKKISLILLGILLIALFELSLLLTGKIFLLARDFYSPIDSNRIDKLILCIGDSHTFGVGAIGRYSYPKQLEGLLNLNNPETTFKVVNLGIPGNSTKSQIKRLEAFLSKNKTDLAILLTGRNNYYEVKRWKNKSFLTDIVVKIQTMRIYRIMQYVLDRFFKIRSKEDINTSSEPSKYEEYMGYYLNEAKGLCEKHGCKLLLISYHNSHDEYIEKFAKRSGILYFNLDRDFFKTIPQENLCNFVSRDNSHMNPYGYKIFTELLYKQMVMRQKRLNLALNPLPHKTDKDDLYKNTPPSYLTYIQGKSVFY